MVQYKSWSDVPGYLKTRAKLEKLGLTPRFHDSPDAIIDVFDKYGYKKYYLYDISKCLPLENYVLCIDRIEMTTENLGEALYVINKSAKRIRDSKKDNYDLGQYDSVKRSKLKEQELYNLKEKVLSKMLAENRAEIIGIHKQIVTNKSEYEWENHLLLINVGEYSFHLPVKMKDIKKHPFLGEIDIITAEKDKKTKLTFTEAVKLLGKYIDTPTSEEM